MQSGEVLLPFGVFQLLLLLLVGWHLACSDAAMKKQQFNYLSTTDQTRFLSVSTHPYKGSTSPVVVDQQNWMTQLYIYQTQIYKGSIAYLTYPLPTDAIGYPYLGLALGSPVPDSPNSVAMLALLLSNNQNQINSTSREEEEGNNSNHCMYLYQISPTVLGGRSVLLDKHCFDASIPEWEKITTDSQSNVERASMVFLASSHYISAVQPRSNSLTPLFNVKISDVRVFV